MRNERRMRGMCFGWVKLNSVVNVDFVVGIGLVFFCLFGVFFILMVMLFCFVVGVGYLLREED